jgi:hypothetical protein
MGSIAAIPGRRAIQVSLKTKRWLKKTSSGHAHPRPTRRPGEPKPKTKRKRWLKQNQHPTRPMRAIQMT